MNHAGAEAKKNINSVMDEVKKNKLILLLIISSFYYQCTTTRKVIKPFSEDKPVDEPLYKKNPYYYYSLGIIEENRGNIRRAIYYLKKAYKIKKASEITHEIASCYLQVDDLTNAENYIRRAVTLSPKNLDHRFMLVNIYLLQQDNKKAIQELKKIIKIEDNNYEVYYDIGTIYQNMGNYKKAIFYYNKVLELNKNHDSSIYNLGNIYYNLFQKKKAIEYFEKFLQYNNENVEAKFIYAYLLTLTGEYDKAISIYEGLFKILPENNQLSKELSEIYFLRDDDNNCRKYLKLILIPVLKKDDTLYKAMRTLIEDNETYAKDLFLKVIQNNENDLTANYGLYKIYVKNKDLEKLKKVLINLGKIFYNNENYPFAIKFFSKYKELFPDDISLYSYLGIVYESLKQYDKAVEELKIALKIKPDDVKLNFYLGVLLDQQKDYENAIEQLKKVIKLDKKHLYAYIRLSYIYHHLDQYEKAVSILKDALSIMPKESDLYFLLGINYSKLENHDRAIKTFEKGIAYNKTDQLLNFQLAIAYDKKNDKKNAINKLLICLELDRDDPDVNNYLAYLYSELDINLKDAKRYIEISLNTDYENYAYLDTAGWIYYRLNDLERAKFYLEKSRENMVKYNKYEEVIYEHLIALYKKLGDQKMIVHYKKFLGSQTLGR